MTEAVGEISSIDVMVQPPVPPQGGLRAVLSKNIAASLVRVGLSSLVALVLPAYLTHRLPVAVYGAWVLILQLGAYVSFLDFGIQTGVSKFVAEYEARNDNAGASQRASAGFAIMLLLGLVGIALTVVLAWQVPRLFHTMPAALYRDVRLGVLMIGASLAFQLVCSVFGSVFLGLQRYGTPMAIAVANRLLYAAVICIAVFLHGSLAEMGFGVAVVNVATSILQVVAWQRLANWIKISLRLVDRRVFKQMTNYCAVLGVWTVGMLFVSGLDLTIVGHYDYSQTAYYSIAILPTNFVVMIIGSMMGPLMPASSALSTQRTPAEMGQLLSRATRYSTIMLLLMGLPFIICGFPILRLWVGPSYAAHSLRYLQLLVVANILRNSCLPFATMIVATGKQVYGMVAAISEATVNLAASVYLAKHYGAAGVAVGTLLGAVASVSLHFAVSMHFTYRTLSISRVRLFLTGFLRPGIIAIPSALLFLFFWLAHRSVLSVSAGLSWTLITLCAAWFGSLNREERIGIAFAVKRRLHLFAPAS